MARSKKPPSGVATQVNIAEDTGDRVEAELKLFKLQLASAIDDEGDWPELPDEIYNGQGNPAHFRCRYAENQMIERATMHGKKVAPAGFDFQKARKAIDEDARSYGFDPKHLRDVRSKEEKAADAAMMIAENAAKVFEFEDGELQAVLEVLEEAVEVGNKYVEQKLSPKNKSDLKKVLSVLRKVKALRDAVRKEYPIPGTWASWTDAKRHAYRATHLIRIMVYVQRSVLGRTPAEKVMRSPFHLCKAVIDLYDAENKIRYHPIKDEYDPDDQGEIEYHAKFKCDGIVIWMPPRHSKTTIATAWVRKRIAENPNAQGVWLHAAADRAEDSVDYVKAAFSKETAEGRRFLALYPHLQMSDHNNKGAFTVMREQESPDCTLEGCGVSAKRLGVTHDFQVRDDIVDQDDAEQESTRRLRVQRIQNTWGTRLVPSGFTLNIGYPWHHQDVMCQMVRGAQQGKNNLAFSKQAIVEKKSGSLVPVWPQVYDHAYLKEKRANMNRQLWNSNYLMDPTPDTDRIIRALRFYDAKDDQEVNDFCQAGAGMLSLDPAGTNRPGSDPAGIVYSVDGAASREVERNGVRVFETERQIRIIDAQQVNANATELFQHSLWYCAKYTVDIVFAEVGANQFALSEKFKNELGVDVIECQTGNLNKEVRLKRASPMLDDSIPGSRAVVLFPGMKVPDGKGGETLGPDPDYQWLYDQFLGFGRVRDDHCLDCVTQMCNNMSQEVGVGVGVVTNVARMMIKQPPAHVRVYNALQQKLANKDDPLEEESFFIRSRW